MLGSDPGTTPGVSRVQQEGGLDGQAFRFEGDVRGRTVDVNHPIERHAGHDRVGICIEAPFFGQFLGVKALSPMLGAAVLACELARVPWTTVDLGKLRLPATNDGQRFTATLDSLCGLQAKPSPAVRYDMIADPDPARSSVRVGPDASSPGASHLETEPTSPGTGMVRRGRAIARFA